MFSLKGNTGELLRMSMFFSFSKGLRNPSNK